MNKIHEKIIDQAVMSVCDHICNFVKNLVEDQIEIQTIYQINEQSWDQLCIRLYDQVTDKRNLVWDQTQEDFRIKF